MREISSVEHFSSFPQRYYNVWIPQNTIGYSDGSFKPEIIFTYLLIIYIVPLSIYKEEDYYNE